MQHQYQDVAAKVVSIIDWETLGIPKGHATIPAFKALTKRLWFESTPDLSNLYGAVEYLCMYGFLDRARAVGLAVMAVPKNMPNGDYGYLQTCVVLPCCFLERAGEFDAAEPLRKLTANFGYGPRAFDGSMVSTWQIDPRYDVKYQIGTPLSNINALATLWVMGSTNKEYTKQRIGELLDTNLAQLFAVPGWQPWK